MILRSNSNQKYILFYKCSHLCIFTTVQSGHQKSPARTKVNLWKISLWKNKVNMIILITLVIQYGNSHLNLKSEDLRSNAFVETNTALQKQWCAVIRNGVKLLTNRSIFDSIFFAFSFSDNSLISSTIIP